MSTETAPAASFSEWVRSNQQRLSSALRPRYDFTVCGAGSSGSMVARLLAENPDASVLLLEAGGDDDVPAVTETNQWPNNIGSERDWSFHAASQRSIHPDADGQGAGRRVQHQRHVLGPRTQKRLGLLRRPIR